MSETTDLALPIRTDGTFELRSLRDCVLLATFYGRANMLPITHRGPEQAAIAIQAGLALNWQPLQALRCIAVINGRPTIHSEGIAAVCGLGRDVTERVDWLLRGEPITAESVPVVLARPKDADELTCRVTWTRGTKICQQAFGVRDARKAGLWGKSGPWMQYPGRMLYCRARSWCARDLCADRLMGMDAGELLPSGEVVNELEPPPEPIREPKRITATVVDIPPPPPPPPDATINVAHRKRLFAIAHESRLSHAEIKDLLKKGWGLDSTKDITVAIYDDLCAALQRPAEPPHVDLIPDPDDVGTL